MSQELRKRCEGLIHENLGLSLDSPKETDALLRFVESEAQREREEVATGFHREFCEGPTTICKHYACRYFRSRGVKCPPPKDPGMEPMSIEEAFREVAASQQGWSSELLLIKDTLDDATTREATLRSDLERVTGERDLARDLIKKPVDAETIRLFGETPDTFQVGATSGGIGGIFVHPSTIRRMAGMVTKAESRVAVLEGALKKIEQVAAEYYDFKVILHTEFGKKYPTSRFTDIDYIYEIQKQIDRALSEGA